MVDNPESLRAGFVALAGRPNAGKSSLLNALVGDRLAIISPKPQSTRHRVVGLRTDEWSQMVLLDTPGLLDPRDTLHDAMRQTSLRALRDADVIVHVVDSNGDPPELLVSAAQLDESPRAPVVLALNKTDLLDRDSIERLRDQFPEAVLLSTKTGHGIDALVARVRVLLPLSPFLYPVDEASTLPTRFFCAEFIRETVMEQLGDELPHATACEIEEFREERSPLYIRAVLYVERESQKRIVIGNSGQQVKKLGTASRRKIEKFLDRPVYLDLWVKVLHNWRRNRSSVMRLGYDDPRERR